MDFTGRATTLKNIEPELENRIRERMNEIAKQFIPNFSYTPLVAQAAVNDSVHIAFASPEARIPTGSGHGEPMSVLGTIIGAGTAVHGKSLSKQPCFSWTTAEFASMDDLILSLNALAKDQSQKIDLPKKTLSAQR